MSGGSQHNPNGRQAQLAPGWSPLQVASYLARAPQAHMASERGVTWHTPTPPHLYHVPAPSPPDPLQAMKGAAAGNPLFRHTATPPDLFRHTPTPPDKHLLRHTPSPGDVKGGAALPATELFPHIGPARDKLRPEDMSRYGRGGVDLSVSRAAPPAPPHAPAPAPAPAANGAPLSLSVRDAPTINNLLARARPAHRVDSLLERLAPPPAAPPAPRAPSPPSSNEDEENSCGATSMPHVKRKRKPDRTLRLPIAPDPAEPVSVITRAGAVAAPAPNGDAQNGPASPGSRRSPPRSPPRPLVSHARRKTRSGSAETIDDIAAMIADTAMPEKDSDPDVKDTPLEEQEPPVTVDKLKSVLASPETERTAEEKPPSPGPIPEPAVAVAAPKRAASESEPVESPSEARPAEPDKTAEPTAASFVEVETELEKMFAGIEEQPKEVDETDGSKPVAKRRRKSMAAKEAPKKGRKRRASVGDAPKSEEKVGKGRGGRGRAAAGGRQRRGRRGREGGGKDAYDSGSNASSGRSRGPYIQITGPRDSPLSVSVMNACATEEDAQSKTRGEEFRGTLRARGLHASTLGLRYDAATRDPTWLCVFCGRPPHRDRLGDLFGPYALSDESGGGSSDVWLHGGCALWAGGVVAAGARLRGLRECVRAARAGRCARCGAGAAPTACAAPHCSRRAHYPCARDGGWSLDEGDFRALCPAHTHLRS